MCFYDQNVFTCGDYRWGNLQQRCDEHDEDRGSCESKLVFRTIVINTKCETCQEIEQLHQNLMNETEYMRRWQRQGSEYSNNIQSSRERIHCLREVIEGLEIRRREDYFDATGIYVGMQELPSDATHSLASPEVWNMISSGISGEVLPQKLSSINRPPNPDLDSHHEDHARYITETIPIHKPQPAVLLTTPENVLLILRTSDFWNRITNTSSVTDQRQPLPLSRAGTKSRIEPSLVSWARKVSGIYPDIRILLEGYNVLDTISHMTAKEINGVIDITEPRLHSGPSNLGSVNLDIPYHWISLSKMSYDLDLDARRKILKLLFRVLTFSNAIFDDNVTMSTMALNEESSLYEQLLGRIKTRRHFVRKLSADIEAFATGLSPSEIQTVSHHASLKLMRYKGRQYNYDRIQNLFYLDASFIEILDVSNIPSKLNIVTAERFFVFVICDIYRSLLDVLCATSWERSLSSTSCIKQLARDRTEHNSIFSSPFPGLWACRIGTILWKPSSENTALSIIVLELSSPSSTRPKLGELVQLHQSLPRWPFFVAVWYCTATRAQQRKLFRYCYAQLFDFVFFKFTDRLRKHVDVYAKMGLNTSQSHLELFYSLADNRNGAFDNLLSQAHANGVDGNHMMRLLGSHSLELLNCVDSVFQDLVPRTTLRRSRQATSNAAEDMVVCQIPEKLDLREEKNVSAGPASSVSVCKAPPEESSCGQRLGLLDRIFAFSSRLFQAVGLRDPPLETGKFRVKWKCTCGRWMYDDFIELRPGAAKELERELNSGLRETPSGAQAHDTVDTEKSNIAISSYTSSKHQNPKNQEPTNKPSRGYDPRPQHDGSASTIVDCEVEGRWLLVCAVARKPILSLSQMDVRSTTSDRDLFKQLKQSFSKLKGRGSRLFSLRTVKSIRFVQFELHSKDLVDIQKVPDMPSETRKEEYIYEPCGRIPPVGENMMTHYFHHPEDAERSITCLRAPKKRKNKLEICQGQHTNVGWGIQIVEGWIISRVWLLTLTLFLFGSLVFGIGRSVVQQDVQGAFGVASYMVNLVVLVVGSVQACLG